MATTWADLLDVGDRELDPAASAPAGEEEPQRRGFFRRLRESLATSREALGAELSASRTPLGVRPIAST